MTAIRMPRSCPTILIVDEEELVARALARMLERWYEVTAMHSARDALRLSAAGHSYRVVLCDMHMPEMAGSEFVQAVGRAHPATTTQVALMSGGPVDGAEGVHFERAVTPTPVFALMEGIVGQQGARQS